MQTSKKFSPREVFLKSLRLQLKDVSAEADLFAENGVMEFPFTPQGHSTRIEGREAIRTFLTKNGFSSNRLKLNAHNGLSIHETKDPEIIIVEGCSEVTWVPTKTNYSLPFIQLLQIRNSEIFLCRDYVNPISAFRAMGGLELLSKMFSKEVELNK